ncbi:hypothetical protein LOD99_6208 [Oopsacas minuta]|uniref:Uncharacterized protein n=1 Tax=Oopsacas minuta TaxID=111878 RepID=A0AAV7JP03_9METZ|nr:hypothetical protein LOD99_6208 [Oopsacas minuta]
MINAVSTDNEQLSNQYEEERLRRRERDSELIKIEESYDLEIRKFKEELDFSNQKCKQFSAQIQSITENLRRMEESQKAKGYSSWYRAPRIQRHPGTNGGSNSVLAVQCLNTSAHLCKDNFLGTNIFCNRGEVVQPGRQPTFKNEKENVTGGHEEISIHQIPENVITIIKKL